MKRIIGSKELYEFSCVRKAETDAAVLVYSLQTEEELWIPLSQVDSMHFDKNGDGSIIVTAWIAKQKGLI